MAIGVILPDDGPFDYEWLRIQPLLQDTAFRSVQVLVERSPADGVMLHENLLAIGSDDNLAGPARKLAGLGAQCILWACTSGSFAGGYRRAVEQAEALSQASGKPATSTSLALAEAAKSLGGSEADLLSAYNGEVTELLVRFLADAGIAVRRHHVLGAVLTEESFAIDIVGEVGQFASGARDSRPILVPDTAINTLGLLGQLQQAAGRPVITANQASLWHAARLVGKASANVLDDFAGLLDRVSG